MAGTSIGPGDAPANLSRRTFMELAAAVSMAPPATGKADNACHEWTAALAGYRQAKAALAIQIALEAREVASACIAAAAFREALLDQLGSAVSSAVDALMIIPAPDMPALLIKMQAAHDDYFRDEPQFGEVFAAILSDMAVLYRL